MKKANYKNTHASTDGCMFVYLGKKPLKIIWKKAGVYAQSVEKTGVSTLTPESFVDIKPVNFKQKEITGFLALLV